MFFFLFYVPGCADIFFCYVWVYRCVFLSGDTLYYRFMSDMSNTEWGYKFTVTGGHRGRFQTGTSLENRYMCIEGKKARQTDSKVSMQIRNSFFWWSSQHFSPFSSPIRLWDTEANVGRWPTTCPPATGRHLGVAGWCGLPSDRKPAPQSHSLVAPPPAVPVPDVRVQLCSRLLFLWLLH